VSFKKYIHYVHDNIRQKRLRGLFISVIWISDAGFCKYFGSLFEDIFSQKFRNAQSTQKDMLLLVTEPFFERADGVLLQRTTV